MNPDHAVDIYVLKRERRLYIERRRDASMLELPSETTANQLGAAVLEALQPKHPSVLAWRPIGPGLPFSWEEVDYVTVSRHAGRLHIGTPLCEWGQAPTLELPSQPKHMELGEAILHQANFPYLQGVV